MNTSPASKHPLKLLKATILDQDAKLISSGLVHYDNDQVSGQYWPSNEEGAVNLQAQARIIEDSLGGRRNLSEFHLCDAEFQCALHFHFVFGSYP